MITNNNSCFLSVTSQGSAGRPGDRGTAGQDGAMVCLSLYVFLLHNQHLPCTDSDAVILIN